MSWKAGIWSGGKGLRKILVILIYKELPILGILLHMYIIFHWFEWRGYLGKFLILNILRDLFQH